ncbi:MAG: D-amino-acid transaminase [Gammaproteobacteria bacterium]|nr:D-amino-acid transaminase [Gammaproteobacteria bacterium]
MDNINTVFLNNEFLKPEQAKVSAFDRGFVFGDGVYEVIPVFGKRPFRLGQHMQRLNNSLSHLGIPNPMPAEKWQEVIQQLINSNGAEDQSIYFQITRGPAARDHCFPENMTPTVFGYSQTLKYPDQKTLEQGVSAITAPDIRWLRCDIKAIALLANVLMRQQAKEKGVTEAILLRDGRVTEGAASNIFIVSNNTLMTPPKGDQILPGITRDLVIELAHANNIPCQETEITEKQLFSADEVWMTSSTKEILPITKIDNKPVGNGKPGPIHKTVFEIYKKYKQDFRSGVVSD